MSKENYKRGIFEKAAERLDLPGEIVANLPVVTVTGCRKVHIENHRGIIGCDTEAISVNCGKVTLKIEGSGLELKGMTDAEIMVMGTVSAVLFKS